MVRVNKKNLPFYSERKGLRFLAITAAIAILVVIAVFWWLKLTGITMSNEAFCGYTEHQHSEECITRELICDLSTEPTLTLTCPETEHDHSDACYEDTQVLICDLDHDHTDECYVTEKTLTCLIGEHQHSEACYEYLPAHEHVDACYKVEYLCGSEDHIHTAACFSNLDADLETKADWEATLPGRTGDWRQDIVSVAASQVGYTESEKNFILAEDGTSRMGYTRYGAWAGNAYGDWTAMFASFCLHYAGIPESYAPQNTGVEAMHMLWQNSPYYHDAGTYTPQTGDIVFLGNSSVELIGVVTDTGNALEAVAGDVNGRVFVVSYPSNDAFILGYGSISEIWNDNNQQEKASEPEEVPERDESSDQEHYTEEYTGGVISGYVEAYNTETKNNPKKAPVLLAANDVTPIDLRPYISGNSSRLYYRLSGETQWLEYTGDEDVPANARFRLDIDYENLPINTLIAAGSQVYYTLPEVFTKVSANGQILDGTTVAGTLSSSGNTVTITFNEDWLYEQRENSNVLRGDFFVEADIDLSDIPEDGELEFKIGDVTVRIDFGEDALAQHATVNIDKAVTPQMIEEPTGTYLEYTLTVTAGAYGCPEVTVIDRFTDMSYIEGYVGVTAAPVRTAQSGTQIPSESSNKSSFTHGTVQRNTDGTMLWTVGNLAPDETRTLTYRVKVSESYVGIVQTNTIQNTATLFAKEYERDDAAANYTPKAGVSVNKSSSSEKNPDGSYTIAYTVQITANADNAYTLKNVKLIDSFGRTDGSYRPYIQYNGNSFALDGEANTPYVINGTPSFGTYIGDFAPGQSKTLTYTVNVDEAALAVGNNAVDIANTATAYDNSNTSGVAGNRLGSAEDNESISAKRWSRKVASSPLTYAEEVSMTPGNRWYTATSTGVTHTNSHPSSFQVPAGDFRYQVVVNETGDWNASSLDMRDSISGDYLKLTGWLRMDIFNTAANPPDGNDMQVINDLNSRTPVQTVWINVEDLTTFRFSPNDLGFPNGSYTYLLTYYAKPFNTATLSNVSIGNSFTISGDVIGPEGTHQTISDITVNQSVEVVGGGRFSVKKYAWYYDKNDSTFSNGSLYWYIKVDGNIVPNGTIFQDSTNFGGSNNYVDPNNSWVGFFYGSLPDGETLASQFGSLQEMLDDQNFFEVPEEYYTASSENLRYNRQDCDLTVTLNTDVALAAGQSLYFVVRTNPTKVPLAESEVVEYGNKENYKLPTTGWYNSHSWAYQKAYGNEGIAKYLGGIWTVDRNGTETQLDVPGSTTVGGHFRVDDLRQVHGGTAPAGTYVAWQVSVNQNGSLNGQTVIVEDLIPAGMELGYMRTFTVNAGNRTYTTPRSGAWASGWTEYHHRTWCNGIDGPNMDTWYYANDDHIQWKIENLQGEIIFQVVCRVSDMDAILSGQGTPFTNRVRLYSTDGNEIDRSDSEVTITKSTLAKRGNYVAEMNGGIYPFVVTINDLGEDLISGSDTITMVDEMSPSLSLLASTIRVVRTGTQTPVDYSYSVNGQRLELTVPDNVPLTITYDTAVNAPPGTPVELYNSIHWQGYAVPEGSEVHEDEFSYESGGSAGGDRSPRVTIIKLDAHFGTRLANATFLLEEGAWRNGAFVGNGKMATATTDSSGQAQIDTLASNVHLAYNTVYKIVETSAPAGYLLDSEPHYFMVARQTGGVWPTVPEGVSVWYNGYEYTYEAYNRGGELYLTKMFMDTAGNLHDTLAGTYTFGVYDKKNPTAEDVPVRTASITYSAAGESNPADGYLHIVGLDLSKTYYVYELTDLGVPILPSDGERHSVAGKPFFVHYSSGDDPISADGNLVVFDGDGSAMMSVVNQIATQPLPSTGAGGTLLYAFGGLAIFLGGCFMLWCVVRRRRKEDM